MATSPPLQAPLWQLLQATSQVALAVHGGRSMTAAIEAVPKDIRPGVQALSFQAMRWWGRAVAIRKALARKAPPAQADALLCTALSLSWNDDISPYPVHTLVNQAVEAARRHKDMRAQAPFVNACLRRFLRERESLLATTEADLTAQWNHPVWWVKRLKADHPEDWQAILQAAQAAAPMSLRVNLQHQSVATYLTALEALGIQAKAVGQMGVQLVKAVPVNQLPGFNDGHVSVQDAAAQLAAPLLLNGLQIDAPSLRLLDACAAPGGKTGHLLECAPQAQVLALEVDPQRCQRIHDNLDRLKVQAEVLAADAGKPETWWDGQAFDGILLDAPCTASGIGRRHPDVRWLRRESDVSQLAAIQAKLLKALWPLVKPGGRLLYCTCSIFKAEGESQIQTFVQHNTDALILPSPGHLTPSNVNSDPSLRDNRMGEHDGFYYALLEKRSM
ncbi:16S rRNA (cytosine(967)-C(5))-methyltransferase RsmB [Limnohabitans sp. Rim11]|uniref:16S rRNA (cytosine(967)-C(5))-methyltransferase RsmB n=1 Tax=Limnohabitans sp. Rim11 TaxID=1100719 RepID=UPI000AA36541|nr:16S rRNA (cytosine(967)-C(5))-methyltransferase RsmB [Limnohabitans sp. Rim11]